MASSASVHHPNDDCEKFSKAFSGMGILGVDEQSMITVLGNWDAKQRQLFRRATPHHFKRDRHFERWEKHSFIGLQTEFSRFQVALTLWTTDHFERDAQFVNDVLTKGYPLTALIEVACTRTSDELLGARRAYHSLFRHSMEEEVGRDKHRNLLVALLSSYRYEGLEVDGELSKREAKILHDAIHGGTGKDPLCDEEVVWILSTRSKEQLKATFDHYREMFGKAIDQDLAKEECLRTTVLCLSSPAIHFSQVLKRAIKDGIDEDGITRVIVTQAEIDMKKIKEAYFKENKVRLEDDISKRTRGNYRDFLVTLLGRV